MRPPLVACASFMAAIVAFVALIAKYAVSFAAAVPKVSVPSLVAAMAAGLCAVPSRRRATFLNAKPPGTRSVAPAPTVSDG